MKSNKYFIVLFTMMIAVILSGCNQRITPTEDLEYDLVDGEITITGYLGTERELVIPDEIEDRPVTKIGEFAFAEYDMTSIELPETVIYIGAYAFSDCNCLIDMEIPEKVEIIGEGAFYHCDLLEKVAFPDGLQRIEAGAFNSCVVLDDINVPEDLEYLGAYSFGNCDRLLEKRGTETPTVIVRDYFWIEGSAPREGYEEYYDAHGYLERKRTFNGGEATTETYENDYENDRLVETRAYDDNANLLYVTTYAYMENGLTASKTSTSVDGSKTIWGYNEQGKNDSLRAYDKEGNLIWEYHFEYNEQGDIISSGRYEEEGELVDETKTEYHYNNFGLIGYKTIDRWYGETTCKYSCNEFGEVTEEITYDEDGEETGRTIHTYDENGNVLETTTLRSGWTEPQKTLYYYD